MASRNGAWPRGGSAVAPTLLSPPVSVSVVVATYNRPEDLRTCLASLVAQVAQHSLRRVEIIVADNNPRAGHTPRVVAEFPGVVLVREARQGEAYARNAGIVASTGEVVITTDDDVTVPPGWLERLVSPFADPDVMVVTGNTVPVELATRAQCLFEVYGGLGRGHEPRRVDGAWFRSFRGRPVPTWGLGTTANAAFRTSIFSHPQIGLFDEEFGAGSPTGGSDDIGLFYKVLKAGYTLVYEPAAWVWHRHRRTMQALRHQIYSYSRAHVAYHLMTLLRDGDVRALAELTVHLPRWRLHQVAAHLRGRSEYPLGLVLLELTGNLAGPWALWQAHRRVQRCGRSRPYIPPSQRVREREQPREAERV